MNSITPTRTNVSAVTVSSTMGSSAWGRSGVGRRPLRDLAAGPDPEVFRGEVGHRPAVTVTTATCTLLRCCLAACDRTDTTATLFTRHSTSSPTAARIMVAILRCSLPRSCCAHHAEFRPSASAPRCTSLMDDAKRFAWGLPAGEPPREAVVVVGRRRSVDRTRSRTLLRPPPQSRASDAACRSSPSATSSSRGSRPRGFRLVASGW